MLDMSSSQESPTRTRLLDAAAAAFYNGGVSIGVEQVCKLAGVSKRSMYQIFGSKDELLAESLARSAPDYLSQLLPADEQSLNPRDRIMYVFEQLERVIGTSAFRGCPYVSAATELKSDDHPARRVAREFHSTLTQYFARAASDGAAINPELLAQQLTMIHDGATARVVVQGYPSPGLAVNTASVLLHAAGMSNL